MTLSIIWIISHNEKKATNVEYKQRPSILKWWALQVILDGKNRAAMMAHSPPFSWTPNNLHCQLNQENYHQIMLFHQQTDLFCGFLLYMSVTATQGYWNRHVQQNRTRCFEYNGKFESYITIGTYRKKRTKTCKLLVPMLTFLKCRSTHDIPFLKWSVYSQLLDLMVM